ncbi:MAG: cupin domain-containing protein [Elusimicrobiales bacterium]|nr:cupin domain-containing protein [Elusimicrobiales bacterium]
MKLNKENTEHYMWSGKCDGWKLLNLGGLSVTQEKMPPCTCETRHFHKQARQFFFILFGTAVMELDGERFSLEPGEGIEIPPGMPHQIFNKSGENVEFLVIAHPATKDDRIDLGK